MRASELVWDRRRRLLAHVGLLALLGLVACAQRDPQTLALRERIAQGALAPEEVPRFRMSPAELREASDALRDRVDTASVPFEQALIDAVREGDAGAVTQALRAGARVDATDSLGNTSLTYASSLGDLVLVRLLLKERADVDGRGGAMTPLAAAALRGHTHVVRLLLARGADPDALGLNGVAPLVLAVRQNHLTAADALLLGGARTDVLDRSGDHLLLMTITEDQPVMADLLVRRGMDPNTTDADGLTALYWAHQLKRETIALLLEQAGGREQGLAVRESRDYPKGDS